ncbi:unnamed protein product [Rangifer tarandus platyrhynchus]|uniref:Uncharacterized protein n=1 Tax=Rangifer tarandus platyrhynchus TaxID=3082113 RepID=A0ABN8ZFE6_RANTA|nr:unnamed protein product [Rangifer tarandus platyrhynchus]
MKKPASPHVADPHGTAPEPALQFREHCARRGERPDEKDAEASALLCGKSVVWVNRENPQLLLLHLQEPGATLGHGVRPPRQLQEVLLDAAPRRPFSPVIRGPQERQGCSGELRARAACLSVGAQTGASRIPSLARGVLLNSPDVEGRIYSNYGKRAVHPESHHGCQPRADMLSFEVDPYGFTAAALLHQPLLLEDGGAVMLNQCAPEYRCPPLNPAGPRAVAPLGADRRPATGGRVDASKELGSACKSRARGPERAVGKTRSFLALGS